MKSIYNLYQLFTIMKATNYRYPKFLSFFIDHNDGKESFTKIMDSVVEKGRSYRGLNFFTERDLQVLEVIGRGEHTTFGIQGKDITSIRKTSARLLCLEFLTPCLHGIIERV